MSQSFSAGSPFKYATQDSIDIQLNHKYLLDNNVSGTCVFVGNTTFAKGEWIGLIIDNKNDGNNNGTINNKQYFICSNDKGLFVRKDKIIQEIPIKDEKHIELETDNDTKTEPVNSNELKIKLYKAASLPMKKRINLLSNNKYKNNINDKSPRIYKNLPWIEKDNVLIKNPNYKPKLIKNDKRNKLKPNKKKKKKKTKAKSSKVVAKQKKQKVIYNNNRASSGPFIRLNTTKKEQMNDNKFHIVDFEDYKSPQNKILDENDTTDLENEIIRNEKQYQILLNDTSKLEAEIIHNERLWRKHIVKCNENSDNNKSNHKQNENKKDNKANDNNQHNENNNNNYNDDNNAGGDEKKEDKQEDKQEDKKDKEDDEKKDKNDKNKNKYDEEESFNMRKLKQKMELVKANNIYKIIQNSPKYALNDNELMAIMYYCDSASACSKMKKAHRCIIKDTYWQETYYHCTHAIENIYKVLHYQNKQFKQNNDMLQKLYHGSQEQQLNGYDKDQFFFKTITSFSTKHSIAEGYAKNGGMVFIINKAFEGLYNGDLRGANVQWLSNFEEYEYVILPTTYNNINEYKNHKLSLKPSQNVYITSLFMTNQDPLIPHSDTVSTMMQISYVQFDKSNTDNNYYSQQLERKYDADYSARRRDIKLCHIINCDFENADTIPSKQLDIRVFDDAEIQHVYQCHPSFYLRLTTWTNTTEKDIINNAKWSKVPSYFMQIIYVDPELTDLHLQITASEVSSKRKKIFIKGLHEKNQSGNIIEDQVTIFKGKHCADVDIVIDEKYDGMYLFGLYENKRTEKIIHGSNNISVMIEINDNNIPPNNENYYPRCINLETVRIVKDEKNKTVNIYWNTPLETYGEISYKILNHINETERETISMLPYSIPLYYAFLPFKVCTIVTVDESVYESVPSQSIYICGNKDD